MNARVACSRSTTVVALLVLLTATTTAHAQQGESPNEPQKAPEPAAPKKPEKTWRGQEFQLHPEEDVKRTWYGWQTLLLGGATFGLTLGGSYGTGNNAFYVGGGSAMLLEPTIVHLAHGSASRAGWSLMLMVGTAGVAGVVGGLMGPATCDSSKSDMCGLAVIGGFMWGTLIGALLGTVIDSAVLAYDETPVNPPPAEKQKTSFNLVPQVWVGKDQATFGLVGSF